jgi:Predicted transcriptional regulators
MSRDYEDNAKIFKALSDPSRLRIIDILSCEGQCACDILEKFDFTQPTLSYHMKILIECGIVKCKKDGLWSYYSLNNINCNKLMVFFMNLVTCTADYISKVNSESDCEFLEEYKAAGR